MRTRLLMVVLVLAMVAAACGDDDVTLTGEAQALADALFADMNETSIGDELPAEDMRCFADGIVAELGVARLGELGVTVSDVGDPEEAFRAMTDPEMESMADLGLRCIDYAGAFATGMEAQGLSPSSAECLTDRLADSDFFRVSFITSMRGVDFSEEQDAALMPVFLEAAGDCLTAEEFATFMGG